MMNGLRKMSCALLYGILLALAAVAPGKSSAAEKVNFDDELEGLLKRLRSEELRNMAKVKVKQLDRSHRVEVRKPALFFFADVRAHEVLLAALATKDDLFEHVVLGYCMDVFGVESLPKLYAIARARVPATEADIDDSEHMNLVYGRENVARTLTSRAAKLLKVKAPDYPILETPDFSRAKLVTTQPILRDWWLKMAKEARAREPKAAPPKRGDRPSPLTLLLRELDKAPPKKK